MNQNLLFYSDRHLMTFVDGTRRSRKAMSVWICNRASIGRTTCLKFKFSTVWIEQWLQNKSNKLFFARNIENITFRAWLTSWKYQSSISNSDSIYDSIRHDKLMSHFHIIWIIFIHSNTTGHFIYTKYLD